MSSQHKHWNSTLCQANLFTSKSFGPCMIAFLETTQARDPTAPAKFSSTPRLESVTKVLKKWNNISNKGKTAKFRGNYPFL